LPLPVGPAGVSRAWMFRPAPFPDLASGSGLGVARPGLGGVRVLASILVAVPCPGPWPRPVATVCRNNLAWQGSARWRSLFGTYPPRGPTAAGDFDLIRFRPPLRNPVPGRPVGVHPFCVAAYEGEFVDVGGASMQPSAVRVVDLSAGPGIYAPDTASGGGARSAVLTMKELLRFLSRTPRGLSAVDSSDLPSRHPRC